MAHTQILRVGRATRELAKTPWGEDPPPKSPPTQVATCLGQQGQVGLACYLNLQVAWVGPFVCCTMACHGPIVLY